MPFLKTAFSLAFTLGLLWLMEIPLGPLPPLGKFFNPGSGFWQNAEKKESARNQVLGLSGLKASVSVFFDEHSIPHIFADNDHDLYYVQGYLTARDRLWQMDVQTRSASGRLSEILGSKTLDIDRYHRRMGMVYGAEKTIRGILKDPELKLVAEAYSEGVNTYIHSLKEKDFPIEFKLLNYSPEEWQPINSALLLKLMSETLAGGSSQLSMTNNLEHFGPGVMNDLFPDFSFHEEPIIPKGTHWDFSPVPIPKSVNPVMGIKKDSLQDKTVPEGLGSNNWAISGSKTQSGFPILANDPHLHLTLPSIWYQIQLSSPNTQAYGVSLPGAPCIIIGYNQAISWGVTNVDADVLDWYHIRFKDTSRKEYWYNNQWNKTQKRIEAIKVKGGKTEFDTVIYTHQGPVVYESEKRKPGNAHSNIPVGDALRWVAHEESNDLKTFYLLNRGKNYEDYRKALTYYTAPAQNFVFASNDKDIALTVNGKFPLKYRDQGKYILDGAKPDNDWKGWIPYNQNPYVKNPDRGFVSSANQASTDSTYPYYINWHFGPYERGKRINERLSQMNKANIDSMRSIQNDTYSIMARDILPTMLGYLDTGKLEANEQKAYSLLKKWDKHFSAGSIGASIFNTWWLDFYAQTWNDEFDLKSTKLQSPSRDRTEQLLLQSPGSHWFDNIQTPEKEGAKEIVNQSFHSAVQELIKKQGLPGNSWSWGLVKKTYISHLANIPGFGIDTFSADGNSHVVNALRDGVGPSWRMVVQMGHPVRGYAAFPGGESGNPGSFHYMDLFQTWKEGKLNPLLFLNTKNEHSDKIKSTLILKPL